MSDLVGNLEDRFYHDEAKMLSTGTFTHESPWTCVLLLDHTIESGRVNTCTIFQASSIRVLLH